MARATGGAAPAPAAPAPAAPVAAAAPAAPSEPEPVAVDKPESSAPVYVPPAAGHTPSSGAGEAQGEPAGVCANPVEAFKKVVLENYLNFSGRASRSEYWWFYLAACLLAFFFTLVNEALGGLVWLAVFIPFIGVTVRRLHDTGKSGFYLLVSFIPFFGPLALLYWTLQDSEKGSNAFGPNPKGE